MAALQRTLDFIIYKCWLCDEAVRLGSEDAARSLSSRKASCCARA